MDVNKINARIDAIANAEKVTKAELAALSREVLEYVTVEASGDVGVINRLLNVLTPMNHKTACLFFVEFIPHTFEENNTFGAKFKGQKKVDAITEAVNNFLANEDNNIWTWAAANIKLEKKPKDYLNKLTKLVERALADDEEGISMEDIMLAVFEGGVDTKAVIDVIAAIEPEKLAA